MSIVLNIKDDEIDKLSAKQLRDNLKEKLRKSGVLDTIRAQIRHEFIKGVRRNDGIENKAISFKSFKNSELSLNDRVKLSMIYYYLKEKKMLNSLSVLVAEIGLDVKTSLLLEEDINQMLKLSNNRNKNYSISTPGENNQYCSFDHIIDNMMRNGSVSKYDVGVQTEKFGPSIVESLELEMKKQRREYDEDLRLERQQPARTIEEKMISYQRECEDRMKRDIEIQVQNIRENEVIRVRLDEAQKYRIQLEVQRKELESEFQRRLQLYIEREAESAQRVAEKERSVHQSQYEARQLLQREIDELRSREQAMTRKLDLETQGLRVLELRLKESQNSIEQRERDIQNRERTVEEKSKECLIQARKEAKALVQGELEKLTQDRSVLLADKQRLEDEKVAHATLLDSAHRLRVQLHEMMDKYRDKEDEMNALKRNYDRLHLMREEEEARITELMSMIDPKFSNYSRPQQMVLLIQRNSELEIELSSLRDAKKLEENLQKKEEEVQTLKASIQDIQKGFSIAKKKIVDENDQLTRQLAITKAKLSGAEHKVQELSKVLNDQQKAFEILQKNANLMKESKSKYNTKVPMKYEGDRKVHYNEFRSYDIGRYDGKVQSVEESRKTFHVDDLINAFRELGSRNIPLQHFNPVHYQLLDSEQLARQSSGASLQPPPPPYNITPIATEQRTKPTAVPTLEINVHSMQKDNYYRTNANDNDRTKLVDANKFTFFNSEGNDKLSPSYSPKTGTMIVRDTGYRNPKSPQRTNQPIDNDPKMIPTLSPKGKDSANISVFSEAIHGASNLSIKEEEQRLTPPTVSEKRNEIIKVEPLVMTDTVKPAIENKEDSTRRINVVHSIPAERVEDKVFPNYIKTEEKNSVVKLNERVEASESCKLELIDLQFQEKEAKKVELQKAKERQMKEEEEEKEEALRLENKRIEDEAMRLKEMEKENKIKSEGNEKEMLRKQQDDADAAELAAARARVLARKKQKGLRDSGESVSFDREQGQDSHASTVQPTMSSNGLKLNDTSIKPNSHNIFSKSNYSDSEDQIQVFEANYNSDEDDDHRW